MVLHSCDTKLCCNPAHLAVGTVSDNNADGHAKGIMPRGSRVNTSKLTPDAVQKIRARLAAGESQRSLARAFGVDKHSIVAIRRGRAWAWLPYEAVTS